MDLITQMDQYPQVHLPLQQELHTDLEMYTREIFIPAGTIALGLVHKQGCLNIITRGSMLVKTSIEDPGVRVDVPENQSITFTTEPGSQKMVYAITDTIIINVFNSISLDIKDVPYELVEQPERLQENKGLPCHSPHQQLL